MKRIKFFALLLVAVFLLVGILSGCGGGDSKVDPTEKPSGTDTEPTENPDPVDEEPHAELENGDITIVYWQSMKNYQNQVAADEDVYDPILDAVKPFEEKYGGTVTVKAVNWGDMLSTMTQMQNAGTAPDLVMVYDRTMHSTILNNFVMPLDDYVTDADYSFYKVSKDLFSWKGSPYAIPIKPYPYYIMFNRDMFEMEGLEAPDELFQKGEWNFDKFDEVGKALTKRVDGELVQYAFTSWDEIVAAFIISNGSAIVNVDTATGTVTSGLSDPKTQNAMNYISRWVDATTGTISIGDNDFYAFDNNICAMNRGKEYPVELPFETGMVPVPAGPDAPPKTMYVYPQALAVPTGAPNPKGAAAFVYMINQHQKEVGDAKEASRIGQENYDMIYADDVNYVYAYDKAIDSFDSIQASMINYMSEGMPAATIAETLESQLQAAIDKMFGGQ